MRKLIGCAKIQTDALEKRKAVPVSSRKTPVSIWRSLPVFWTVPPSETRIFGVKTLLLGPRNNFPIIVALKTDRYDHAQLRASITEA